MKVRKFMEKYDPSKRDTKDLRKRHAWAVFSYVDEHGNEYRKSFTLPVNSPESDFWKIAPNVI